MRKSIIGNYSSILYEMKKLFFLAFFACYATVVMSQNAVGKFSISPIAGINIADFSNDPNGVYKSKLGLTGGVEMEYGVNDFVGLSLGLLYSQGGARMHGVLYQLVTDETGQDYHSYTDVSGKVKSEYLVFPLLANIYIPLIKGLAFKTGVQFGVLVNDKLEADTETVLKKDIKGGIYSGKDYLRLYKGTISETDICKSIDFGIPIGLSYEYKSIKLDARYYFGLTKIDKSEDSENIRNRFITIHLGYRFRL